MRFDDELLNALGKSISRFILRIFRIFHIFCIFRIFDRAVMITYVRSYVCTN